MAPMPASPLRLHAALALALALALASGCSEEEAASVEPPPRVEPIPRAPLAAPRAVAGPAAFDLVAVAEGALLVWGAPSERGGAILLLPLDRQGDTLGDEVRVFLPELPTDGDALLRVAPEAVEVVAATGGGRLGVAWLSRYSGQYEVLAGPGDAGAARVSPPRRLARLRGIPHGRGHVAVAGSGAGDLRVLHEAGRGRCPGGRGRCARFSVRGIGRTGGREGVPLSVPEPCVMPITGFAFTGGSWYYGVCALRDESPTTTVFAIQYDPAYAHSEDVLAGCPPAGMVPLPDGVLAVGRCEGGAKAARVRDAGRQVFEVGAVAGEVGCDEVRPVLRAGEGAEALSLTLDAPTERIESLLPERIAPAGSRAVWTGEAILVAVPLGPEVSLHRYACEDGALVRTQLP